MTAPPAIEALEGMQTHDGWTVGELVQRQSYQTGSCFSVGYIATHEDGRKGFLKALDFRRAEIATDQMRALEFMTRSYNFERDVLALCRGANLDKVVVAISDGALTVPSAPFGRVSYLIFELADGDVRKHAVMTNLFDAKWSLIALQHIATGLSQLHNNGVYHQDVKPSNILVFESGKTSKIADLGRSHCTTIAAPHDEFIVAGQPFYAAPEHLYNYWLPDIRRARAAADLYLLGSMVYFFFTGAMLTPTMVGLLRPEHKPPSLADNGTGWNGTYDDVLPYLRAAYADAIIDFEDAVRKSFSEHYPKAATELIDILRYLTEPSPELRGHPADRRMKHGNPYGLSRFVSAFNRFVKITSVRMP